MVIKRGLKGICHFGSQATSLFHSDIHEETLNEIRKSVNHETVLGNDRFKEEIEQMLQRRIEPHSHGGDRKSEAFKQLRDQYGK